MLLMNSVSQPLASSYCAAARTSTILLFSRAQTHLFYCSRVASVWRVTNTTTVFLEQNTTTARADELLSLEARQVHASLFKRPAFQTG